MRTSESAKQLKPFIVSWIDRILANGARDLGTPSAPFNTIYADTVQAGTIIGVLTGAEWEVAGNPIIDANQASATSTVYIVNQAAGGVANLDVENDIIVGGLVDGVDIAAHAADANAHHNQGHVLATAAGLGADHTVSGLTAGHVLRASGATAAAFAQLAHDDLSGIGSNSHSQIDSHIANTSNPHSVTAAQLGLVIGTNVQAWDANLDQIAALTPTDSNIIVGNGSAWVAESGATARTSLGLGTGDSPTFAGLTSTGNVVLPQGGTAAAPVLTFTGDTNTGLYRTGADSWAVVANGQIVAEFDGTAGFGRLGVGKADPLYVLDVNGDAYFDDDVEISGNLGVGIAPQTQALYVNGEAWITDQLDVTGVVNTAGLTDSTLNASRLLATNGSKRLVSVTYLSSWIAGTINQVAVADDGDGSVTLSTPQNIHTGATPTFARLTLSQTTGTAPMTISSTTVVSNLNADKADGFDFDQDVRVAGTPQFARLGLGNAADGSYSLKTAGKARFGDSASLDSSNMAFESSSFVSGWAGSGFRLEDSIAVASTTALEIDEMTVRGRLRVYELLVQQLRATNGSVVVANTGKADSVTDNGGGSYTIDTDDAHGFAVNDLIRAQRFTGTGVYQSNLTVTAVASATQFTATLSSGDAPTAGMEFVRLGNTTDSSRQGAVYLTADDTYAPYIDILDGVSDWAHWGTADKTKVRLGKLTGISDAAFGGALSGYGLYSINAYLKGALVAGSGGEVVIDDGGISIEAGTGSTNSVAWNDGTYTTGSVSSDTAAGTSYLRLIANGNAGNTTGYVEIHASDANRAANRQSKIEMTSGVSRNIQITTSSTSISGYVSVAGNVNAGGAANGVYALNVSGDSYLDGDLTVDTDTLHVDAANNRVGIGTTGPGAKLDVVSSGISGIVSDVSTTNYALEMRVSGVQKWGFYTTAADAWALREIGVQDPITVLKTSGNVGIGTAGPGRLLELSSADNQLRLRQAGGDNYTDFLQGSTGLLVNNVQDADIQFRINGSDVVTFETGGNVGIGTTGPGYKLDVSGNVRLSGNVGIQDTPDTYALKVNGDMYANRIGLGTAPDTSYRLKTDSGDSYLGGDVEIGGDLTLAGWIAKARTLNQSVAGAGTWNTGVTIGDTEQWLVNVMVSTASGSGLSESAIWLVTRMASTKWAQLIGGAQDKHTVVVDGSYEIDIENDLPSTTLYFSAGFVRIL